MGVLGLLRRFEVHWISAGAITSNPSLNKGISGEPSPLRSREPLPAPPTWKSRVVVDSPTWAGTNAYVMLHWTTSWNGGGGQLPPVRTKALMAGTLDVRIPVICIGTGPTLVRYANFSSPIVPMGVENQ